MTQASNISQADSVYFKRVIRETAETGLISTSEKEYFVEYKSGLPCCLCFCPSSSPNRKENDACKIIAAIFFFVISSFVGAYFTKESIKSYLRAKSDLKIAKENIGETIQYQVRSSPYSPESLEGQAQFRGDLPPQSYPSKNPPPFNPQWDGKEESAAQIQQLYPKVQPQNFQPVKVVPVQVLPVQEAAIPILNNQPRFQINEVKIEDKRKELYNAAKELLTIRKDERKVTALAQGFITAGATFITIALLISLCTQPGDFAIASGAFGTGLLMVGGTIYLVKLCYYMEKQEEAQRTADFIIATLPRLV